jgi:hypothetical protein
MASLKINLPHLFRDLVPGLTARTVTAWLASRCPVRTGAFKLIHLQRREIPQHGLALVMAQPALHQQW